MIDYAANAPRGHMGDPRRGAPLGRASIIPEGAIDSEIQLRRVHLDRDGYDELGAYFGIGEPVWWAATDDGSLDTTFRAADRAAALAHLRTILPAAAIQDATMTDESGRNADFAANPGFADYLATMLEDAQHSESDEACTEDREARDVGTIYTLTEETYRASLADWRRFAGENAADIAAAGELEPGEDGLRSGRRHMTPERIGSTLWLARTGSGVGFTDDGDAECLQRLDAAARALGNVDAYLGDDGDLYLG